MVSETVEHEMPVARAIWRLDGPASNLRRRTSFVFRIVSLPYATPTSLAVVNEVECDASWPCVAGWPVGDSAHEAGSDRLALESVIGLGRNQ